MSHLRVVPAWQANDRPLPVAWDGVPVTWSEEALPVGSVFICPPPKPRPCPACKQIPTARDSYVGRLPELVPAYWDRHPKTGQPRKHHERTALEPRLVLTRCLDCGHDQVYDLDTNELWDLDETDYGDEGSWERQPTLF